MTHIYPKFFNRIHSGPHEGRMKDGKNPVRLVKTKNQIQSYAKSEKGSGGIESQTSS